MQLASTLLPPSPGFAWRNLRGGAGRSDLPIETVKRLLCDCSYVTVFEDDNGNPLDVGRKQRTLSRAPVRTKS